VELVTEDSTSQVRSGFILVSGILMRMLEFGEFPEYTFDLMPGAGTACCVDDVDDLTLANLYSFPVRSMKSVNGEELLCLILTPSSNSSGVFRRVGLLALKRDELEGFEWANGEWNRGVSGLGCIAQTIKIV
jgi:hypothetical protein